MIKVADFGMSEDMYARNYFRHDKSDEGTEEKVPIRWMAPESIENGIYTERSDVVRQYSPLGCWFKNYKIYTCSTWLKGIMVMVCMQNVTVLAYVYYIQWAFGVTCWEVFTCGRVPYTGVPAMALLSQLRSGHRLDRPRNATCSDEM